MNIKRLLFKSFIALLVMIFIILSYGRLRLVWTETQSFRDAAPKTGHWVKAHDVELYVQEYGNPADTPVVLVHGTGAWSGTWVSNIESMTQAGFHVIALDLPPFGYSERPATANYSRHDQALRILGAIDALGLKNVILIGHSFGGGPATEAAMQAKGQIQALVLVDAALGVTAASAKCEPAGFLATLLKIRPFRMAVMGTLITEPVFSKMWLKKFVARKEVVTSERVAIYQQPFNVNHYTESLGDWAYDFATNCENALSKRETEYKKLTMPVKLLWGNLDSITPLQQAERVYKLLPNATLNVMQGVGHIPQIEDVALFNATLQSALNSLVKHEDRSPGSGNK
jgi:pimeloyl-ACP methyl ester carboxylesterase